MVNLAIVGSKSFTDFNKLEEVILRIYDKDSLSSVISGGAKGADKLAYEFAKKHNIKCVEKLADWSNLEVPHCKVSHKEDGEPFNLWAGFNRNDEVIAESDEIIAFWNGKSGGTNDVIKKCNKIGKTLRVYYYLENKLTITENLW